VELTTNGYFQLSDTSFDNWTPSSDSVYGYGNGTTHHRPSDYNFYFGYNTSPLDGNYMPVVELEGDNDETYYYNYVFDGSDVWLLFDPHTEFTEKNSYTLTFVGTDTDEDMTIDVYPYVPNESELGGGSSGVYYIAQFNYTEPGGTGTGTIYVDTADGSLPPIGNTNLSNYNYEFEYVYPTTGQDLNMTNYNASDNIQTAYSDYGTKFDISQDYFVAVIPENREKMKLAVEGPEAKQEVTGKETLTAAEGETVTTAAGTKITVNKVSYTVGVTPEVCPAGGVTLDDVVVTPTPATAKTVVPVGQLVYTDAEAFGGKPHVIIGGWKANSLAADVTLPDGRALTEALQVPGDYVVEKLDTGDIIVAGYTAADTVTAAKELIDALDALLE